MTQDRTQRRQDLLATALSFQGAERKRWLDAECMDDVALRKEVEELLSRHESLTLLEHPDGHTVMATEDSRIPESASQALAEARAELADRYFIIEELGRGGMGIVVKAEDLKHNRLVALKILHAPQGSSDHSNLRRRFDQEIGISARLAHPYILPVLDSGRAGTLFYYVTPLADGGTLMDRLEHSGHLSLDESLQIVRCLALALSHAHRAGCLHRDIKPANILFQSGLPLLADFGIAKVFAGEKSSKVETTEVGTLLGTPAYMSPEQLLGEAVDVRSDVYSLGCVLFEMLTGRRPFEGVSRISDSWRLGQEPRASRFREDLPDDIDALLGRALHSNPDERFASAIELVQAIAAVHTGKVRVMPSERLPGGTLAVLPFVNRSSRDDEYLGDGLCEELIRILSAVDDLSVASRSAVFSLKGETNNATTVGQKLRAAYILEGSVQRLGNQLRVRTQLVDVQSGSDLWADRYDRSSDSIFDVQDEIAQSIADVLKLRLSPRRDRWIVSPTAYEYYLRARQQIFRFTEEALDRAVQYLNDALELEGQGSVPLQAALGYSYWQYVNAGIRPDPHFLDLADECANRILEEDMGSSHGFRLLGLTAIHRGQNEKATRLLSRALLYDPNDTDALFWLTLLRGFAGETEIAGALSTRLLRLDPLTPLYQILPGFVALMRADFRRAGPAFATACEMEPASPILRLGFGHALALSERKREAQQQLALVFDDTKDSFFGQLAEFLHLALDERAEEAQQIVSDEFVQAARGDLQYCWMVAQGFSLIGAIDIAQDWVERSISLGLRNRRLLEQDPLLRKMREGKGFARISSILVSEPDGPWS